MCLFLWPQWSSRANSATAELHNMTTRPTERSEVTGYWQRKDLKSLNWSEWERPIIELKQPNLLFPKSPWNYLKKPFRLLNRHKNLCMHRWSITRTPKLSESTRTSSGNPSKYLWRVFKNSWNLFTVPWSIAKLTESLQEHQKSPKAFLRPSELF